VYIPEYSPWTTSNPESWLAMCSEIDTMCTASLYTTL
jgi:hypothetical protein